MLNNAKETMASDHSACHTLTTDEARRTLLDAVQAHVDARGRTDRFSRERDDLIRDLNAAGYPITLDQVDAIAHPRKA